MPQQIYTEAQKRPRPSSSSRQPHAAKMVALRSATHRLLGLSQRTKYAKGLWYAKSPRFAERPVGPDPQATCGDSIIPSAPESKWGTSEQNADDLLWTFLWDGRTPWCHSALMPAIGPLRNSRKWLTISGYRGIAACTLGLGQIPLYAVARHDGTPNERLRGAFKLYALQRSSQSVNHQTTYDAPKRQHYGGWESDSSRHPRLP